MVAFEAALADGAEAIEFDVQLSSDGVLVVHHDRTLKKIAGKPQRVHALSGAALQRLDAGAWFDPAFRGERMPTLDAVLEAFGRRTTLMLEIKVDGETSAARKRMLVDRCVAALRARKLGDRVYVLSFDLAALRRVKQKAPALHCVLDIDRAPVPTSAWRARMAGLHAVCMPARLMRRTLRAALAEAGLAAWVYRCDTEDHLTRALRWELDAVITDWPAWARARRDEATRPDPAPRGPRRSSRGEG